MCPQIKIITMEPLKKVSSDNIKTKSKNNKYQMSTERYYLESNLEYYINKTAVPKRERTDNGGWRVLPDKESNLKRLLVQHILNNYTIKQVYTIFSDNQAYTFCMPFFISCGKGVAYSNINAEASFSMEEKQKLRRRVMGMPPAQFGLIVDLIFDSELFRDNERKESVYPRRL